MYFTEDLQNACCKLAKYFLHEFTEISLYSPTRSDEKVPLEKLYVAIEWITCNQDKEHPGYKSREQEKTQSKKGHNNMYLDYNDIFTKVWCVLKP